MLTDSTASELRRRIGRGVLKPSELMEATLDRIEAVNPRINAIVSLRERGALMAEARAADGQTEGPLSGLPMAVKDLAETKGLRTSYGSPLADTVPDADCGMVARLRAAGAIIIGKTNVPAFGLGSHTRNDIFGPTRNPYDHSRTAGGSSGGAAAALAARMVSLSDGSDMMGSLRNPAGFCNVYGFRPTWGLVPADPVGDVYLHRLSTDGPMARNIEDLWRLLSVQAAPDPRWPAPQPAFPEPDFGRASPRGRRIGWLGDAGGAWPMEAGILDTCRTALEILSELGAEVESVALPVDPEEVFQSWCALRQFSVHAKLGPLMGREGLNAQARWELERGARLSAAQIQTASLARSRLHLGMVSLFERFDAVAMPSAQVLPFPVEWDWPREIAGGSMDTYHRWMEVVVVPSLLGLPTLGMPAGFAGDSPVGMQLAGPPGSDARILEMGHAYHTATNWPERRPPEPGS